MLDLDKEELVWLSDNIISLVAIKGNDPTQTLEAIDEAMARRIANKALEQIEKEK